MNVTRRIKAFRGTVFASLGTGRPYRAGDLLLQGGALRLSEKPPWVRGLAGSSFVAAFFVLLHLTDDLAQGRFAGLNEVVATASLFVMVVWLVGIVLSARQSRVGYALLLIFSLFGTIIALVHTTGVQPSITEIAQTSGVFLAWVVLVAGIASIVALILSVRALMRGGPPAESI